MSCRRRVVLFFGGWIFLGLLSVALNAINIDWQKTPLWQGILLVVVIATLQGSVLELVAITIATLLVRKRKIPNRREVCDNLTLIMNYNLLALGMWK
ncbi:hypothetical protein LSH36_1283g00013 [Paralvinella palmiformis]|uniref:Uncharacterized protein n=1 Tax=Paralvinella palmiformis TaxID=53620 RepID=A0AAD9MRS3_9ANNE|nr:hypothetical protein LSH36_1283g00013 [Paralvinella palmiformis]